MIFVIPVQNPDGRVLDQRRNAYGFDLNRDFFARAQVETDDRVELMRSYPPVLLLDHHEFGYYRSFFPPNADPVHHEVARAGDAPSTTSTDRRWRACSTATTGRSSTAGISTSWPPQFNDTQARRSGSTASA